MDPGGHRAPHSYLKTRRRGAGARRRSRLGAACSARAAAPCPRPRHERAGRRTCQIVDEAELQDSAARVEAARRVVARADGRATTPSPDPEAAKSSAARSSGKTPSAGSVPERPRRFLDRRARAVRPNGHDGLLAPGDHRLKPPSSPPDANRSLSATRTASTGPPGPRAARSQYVSSGSSRRAHRYDRPIAVFHQNRNQGRDRGAVAKQRLDVGPGLGLPVLPRSVRGREKLHVLYRPLRRRPRRPRTRRVAKRKARTSPPWPTSGLRCLAACPRHGRGGRCRPRRVVGHPTTPPQTSASRLARHDVVARLDSPSWPASSTAALAGFGQRGRASLLFGRLGVVLQQPVVLAPEAPFRASQGRPTSRGPGAPSALQRAARRLAVKVVEVDRREPVRARLPLLARPLHLNHPHRIRRRRAPPAT